MTELSEQTMSLVTNRLYKDGLFKAIFGNPRHKKYLLELYNVLNKSNYTNPDAIELTTLDNVVYIAMKNDISFLLASEMHLYEHQSTLNPNIPLRGLMYFAMLYKKYFDTRKKSLFLESKLPLPTPKFAVFYNGARETADVTRLRLSGLFEVPDNSGDFEWTATMYNVNCEHNKNLMDGCKALREYASYVMMVRKNLSAGQTAEDAVRGAMDVAVKENYLDGFFREQKSEVLQMSLTEFDLDEFISAMKENGMNEGRAEQKAEDEKIIAEKVAENERLSQRVAELEKLLAERGKL